MPNKAQIRTEGEDVVSTDRRKTTIGADLDATDRAILSHLQREGRLANKELAERIGLSASACSERVRRLEDAGVVAGYRAIIDWNKLGATFSARAEIVIEGASCSSIDAFARFLDACECVASAERSAQPHVYMLYIVGASIEAWREFLAMASHAGFVFSVSRFNVVMECLKAPDPCHVGGVAWPK